MRTQVTDLLEDDVMDILKWAYGSSAKAMFVTNVAVHQQRAGQAFMNTLSVYDQESYERLSGSLVDPFYQDTKLPAAIELLTSK